MVALLADAPHRSEDANASIWSLAWVGGDVMNSFARTETAYVHRNITTLMRPTTVWPNDAPTSVGDELNAWTDAVIDTLAPYALEESYQNFPNRSIENWEQLYFAQNYERLVNVKTRYDPDNLFKNPQSIQQR